MAGTLVLSGLGMRSLTQSREVSEGRAETVRALVADNNVLTSTVFAEIGMSMVNLVDLRLNGNSIEASELSGLSRLRHLRLLDLSCNKITALCSSDETLISLPS